MLLKTIFAIFLACICTVVLASDKGKEKSTKPKDPCSADCTAYWICFGIDHSNGSSASSCVYPKNCDCDTFTTIKK